jgi:ethanolamine utilization protein EutQ
MSEVKLFRRQDLDLTPRDGIATVPVVNRGYSEGLGAGIGTFEDCAIEWTVSYDEVLFIMEGRFSLRVGDKRYRAGPGDTLWIPRGTALVYEAKERVTFFYAVSPVQNSPSTAKTTSYPTASAESVGLGAGGARE